MLNNIYLISFFISILILNKIFYEIHVLDRHAHEQLTNMLEGHQYIWHLLQVVDLQEDLRKLFYVRLLVIFILGLKELLGARLIKTL